MLKTLFVSIVAFALFSMMHAKATNYYINSNIGKDSNQGTSKGSPWKGFANLEKNRFLPGDSILFANGTSYRGGFIFCSSGTPEKHIVFSGYSLHPDSIRTIPRNKLDSLFRRYGGGPAPAFTNPDWNVLSGNVFHLKGSCITLDGLYFFDNTNPPGSDHKNKNVQKMGAVYFALGSNYNVIKNCEFFHTPVGIKVKGSYNLITHNYLHDANHQLAYSWGPMAMMIVKPNNEICYNTITN
jgi:hypothetical protein